MLIPKAVQSADVTETCFTTGWSWSCRGDVWLGGDGTWRSYALAAVGQSARRNRDSVEWCLAIFGISWYAFFIRWFFILKQLVISIISFLQLKLSRSPRAAVSATRCLDFAFFSYFFAISTSPSQSLWRSRGRHHKPTHVLEDTTSSEGRLRCGRHLQIPAASWARALKKRLYTFLDFLNFLGWTVWVLLLTSSSNGYPKLSRCAGMNRSWEPEWARMSQRPSRDHPETLGQAILLITRGFGKFEFAVKDPRTIWERVPTPAPTDREHQGTTYT